MGLKFMQSLDENIINEIQELINIKEDNIAKLEEESFSQIFLYLKELDNKFKPLFSDLKSRLDHEKAAKKEYNSMIKKKRASIDAKLKEIVTHREEQINEIKEEIKILKKKLK